MTFRLFRCGLAWLVVSLAVPIVNAAPLFDDPLFESPPVEQQSDAELAAVLRLVNAQQIDEAEAAIRAVTERRPRSAPAHEILGTVLALQGDLPEAVLALKKAIELSPEQATAFTKLGDIALALGNGALAKDYFTQAITVQPRERRAHQRLGLLLEREGELETAIHHYEQGIQGTSPAYLGIKLNLAELYVRDGRAADAIDLLSLFLEPDNGAAPSPAVLRTATVAQIRLDQKDQATALAQQLAKQSSAPQDHFLLASLLEQTGDTRQAETTYRHILTLDDRFWPALNNLAALLIRKGAASQGLDYARKAYELSDTAVQPAHTYGWALLEMGDPGEAVKVLEAAKNRKADHALTRYHLGVAYQETGAMSAAKSELQAVLELNDQFEFAADARQRLLDL